MQIDPRLFGRRVLYRKPDTDELVTSAIVGLGSDHSHTYFLLLRDTKFFDTCPTSNCELVDD